MASALMTLLIQQGHLTPEQASMVADHAAREQVPEVQALLSLNLVDRQTIRDLVSRTAGVSTSEDLQLETAQPEATRLLNANQARRWGVVPMKVEGDTVVIAATPKTATNQTITENLRTVLKGRPMRWMLASQEAITAKLNEVYRSETELSQISEKAEGDEVDHAPLASKFVQLTLNQAITDRASDIHVEPGEHEVHVRFRIDGVLIDKPAAAKAMQSAVVNQLKILANLDIGETRLPQDGRLSHEHEGKRVDFRVATLPTVWGEKVVMRILDNSTALRALKEFSLTPANEKRFRASFTKPHGLILVTGPTGSGKSTTLYATLNELNRPGVNIITVEDPVEYRLPRINQIQVNPKAGLTFERALRTILRSDPDIILIGEIRDRETAQIAMEAAQTGHLVLSTLHTNNAPESPARLVEMGVEPFLVATALECVVAQRLVRRLCECKVPASPSPAELEVAGFKAPPGITPKFFAPNGCNKCARTGYRGRFAIQEVMTRSRGLERAIAANRDAGELHDIARADGLTSLRDDGWLKVAQGLTSIDEILRVVS